jgi:DNA-binding NtrC family response regulator
MSALESHQSPLLGLTILWHPESERIGQQFIGPGGEGMLELNRFFPLFRAPGKDGLALGHRCIARTPLKICRDSADGVAITLPDSRMAVEVNGKSVTDAAYLPRAQIERGVVLGLGGLVLVCLHWVRCLPRPNDLPGLLGVSSAMIVVRDLIRQVAYTSLPVLLLGETGSGKDVAARAIHGLSKRAERPFVAVNMAALNESLAAADLFGAAKGAYTGAHAQRPGLFAEAEGGTLFLDEIGDMPAPIQPMLLRVLETGEYRPLGASRNQQSGARLITATDRALEGGAFNQALLRRMEAFVIRLPALRDRREDIGVLLLHFLQTWPDLSNQAIALPMTFISDICNHDWPGNVRQLAHVLRRATMAVGAGEPLTLASFIRMQNLPQTSVSEAGIAPAINQAGAPVSNPTAAKPPRKKLSELTPHDIMSAMENNAWQIRSAAQQLGISRPSLYKLLAAHPAIRPAAAIPAEEIRRVLQEHAGDVSRCAASLKTPSEALRRHVLGLGLKHSES